MSDDNRSSKFTTIMQIPILLYRLAPVIIVGIFVSPLLIHYNIGGLFYFVGLIVNYFMIYFSIKFIWASTLTDDIIKNNNCVISRIGGSVPISLLILCYSFGYLIYSIIINKLIMYNVPTISLFSILIFSDLIYNSVCRCYNLMELLITASVSGGFGVFLSYMLTNHNITGNELHINSGGNNSRLLPGEQAGYKCKVFTEDHTEIMDNQLYTKVGDKYNAISTRK